MKVRTASGACYYLDDEPDEEGVYSGVNKHSGTEALLRWDEAAQEWVVIWEADIDPKDWL